MFGIILLIIAIVVEFLACLIRIEKGYFKTTVINLLFLIICSVLLGVNLAKIISL